MKFFIGAIDDGVIAMESGNPDEPVTELKPYSELYVEAGSWDNHELMVVVEKDAEKLLFIDGSTHTELGRVHDIGFQPHTSVYTEDANYMFLIARDGWLTKIDLNTLEPIKSVNVGESSRGTALTDDGKYLAIGNYIPGNVVIMDPETLEVLKTIPTVGALDGEEIESRVGAMVEAGDKVIVALKDLNSVWVIDTSKPDFPVIEKHWNIGENATPLHDAFLSADGRFYIVASMGSKTVWVMDTETWQPVAEVETGETPHTGPGATWGNKIYIPALGEGLITAIDMTTWEPVSSIKTAGPGLFIRSYPADPDYPYVWAETAFGEFHDEIYVIDARTDEIVKTIRPVEGESSWHPEFTLNGQFVYIVSQTANEIEVYDANAPFDLVKRIKAETPSAVSNIGLRIEEKGL
jgi:DNA-binding beta-propeller fold protein YncE